MTTAHPYRPRLHWRYPTPTYSYWGHQVCNCMCSFSIPCGDQNLACHHQRGNAQGRCRAVARRHSRRTHEPWRLRGQLPLRGLPCHHPLVDHRVAHAVLHHNRVLKHDLGGQRRVDVHACSKLLGQAQRGWEEHAWGCSRQEWSTTKSPQQSFINMIQCC